MLSALTGFMIEHDWRLIALLVVSLAAAILSAALYRRCRMQNSELIAAFDNMSEGLCMFDTATRLILCNRRYIEMYGLTPELTKPGISLRELLDQRMRTGTFAGDPDQYIADALRRMRDGKIVQDGRELPSGRIVSVASRPMSGGGWVATHQDITELRRQDQQRDSLAAQEQRRAIIDWAIAGFRERVEVMLKTVSDGAG